MSPLLRNSSLAAVVEPRWLTPVPVEDIARGDGVLFSDFIEAVCRITKDSIAGASGESIRLREWQRDLLGNLLARRPDGKYRHRQALIGVGRKNGKGLYTGEMILTGAGWKKFGDLQPGDTVHTINGSLTPVLAVTPSRLLDCYRVTFADGQGVTCDADHLWTVYDRWGYNPVTPSEPWSKGTWRTLSTPELAETFRVGTRQDTRYSVRMDRVIDRPAADLPVDPYLFGYWLGDGSTADARFTVSGRDLPSFLEAVGEAGYFHGALQWTRATCTVQVSTAVVRRGGHYVRDTLNGRLRELGALGNKHVPERYLLASAQQRMALLRGLMDSDGAVNVGPNTPRVEFCSTVQALADAVLFLARSLGWKASIKESRAQLNGRDCGPRWRVTWTAHRERPPFRLARKAEKLASAPERPTRSVTNQIVNVERVPSVRTRCIQVAHPSGQFLAGLGLIPTHNSALGAGIGLAGLVLGPHGGEVYSAAADRKQAGVVFDVARRMVSMDPDLSQILKVYRDVIEYPATGSIYRALSSEAFTKEGLSASLTVVDEVHAQPNRELWDVLALAMGARPEPLMVGITTAGVRTDSSGRDSLCYGLYQYGQRVARGEIDDPSFFMAWWEPKDPAADHRSPDTWAEANPGLGDIVSLEDFESMVLRTPEAEFRTKRANQWVATSDAWLPAGTWDACGQGDPIPDHAEVTLGFDGSFSNDSTALVVVSVEDVPCVQVVEAWERPADAGQEWRVPIADVEDTIRQACRRWQVQEIVCDPYRWGRTYQILEDEGLPIVEFPQAQPLDEPVLTPTGWRAMKELEVGDQVVGLDGAPTDVVAVHERGVKPVFEVRLTDGSTTRCTDDHLWYVETPQQRYKGRRGTVRTLREIRGAGLRYSGDRASTSFIPLIKAVEHPAADLPVDPYVLGALLGDGNFSGRATPRITSCDPEIIDRIATALPAGVLVKRQGVSPVHFGLSGLPGAASNPLTLALRELGLAGLDGDGKYIPASYFTASVQQRLDLLRGLMDTDGTCGGNGSSSFHTTTPALRDGLVALVRSLGGTARAMEKPMAGKMRRRAWIVAVAMPADLNPFFLPRKRDLVRRSLPLRHAISDVIPLGEMAVRCITVANHDGLYITSDYVATHNSPARMIPATQRFYEAVLNQGIAHTGDPRLARHLDNCFLKVDQRGSRLTKETRNSNRKIDLAVAAVMAFERAREVSNRTETEAWGFWE